MLEIGIAIIIVATIVALTGGLLIMSVLNYQNDKQDKEDNLENVIEALRGLKSDPRFDVSLYEPVFKDHSVPCIFVLFTNRHIDKATLCLSRDPERSGPVLTLWDSDSDKKKKYDPQKAKTLVRLEAFINKCKDKE